MNVVFIFLQQMHMQFHTNMRNKVSLFYRKFTVNAYFRNQRMLQCLKWTVGGSQQ